MNAAVRAQASKPNYRPARSRQVRAEGHSIQPKRNVIVETTVEATSKLVINTLLGCVALGSLATLIPLAQENSGKLQELTHELNATQQRVMGLQEQLGYYFDPQQARSIRREVSNRVSKEEAPIILIEQN